MNESTAIDIDFSSPEIISDPFAALNQLRETDPVHWHESMRSWCLTRYADLTEIYRDDRFSAERIQSFIKSHGNEDADLALLGESVSLWMVFNDPPVHTRLRKLTQAAFTRKSLDALRPVIARQVTTLLDQMEDQQDVDFVQSFAWPLPANVIADLLGVPREHVEDLKHWSDDLGQFVLTSRVNPEKYAVAARGLEKMNELFGSIIEEKRCNPGDDLIDELIRESDDGERLRPQELIAFCVLLLFAGHETTAHFLASGLRALVQHPDQMSTLRAGLNDARLVTNAVNEMLRWDGPIVAISRHVNETLEFRERTMEAGDRVYLFHGAANRDPRVFINPDDFDITRTEASRMIGFGYGIHLCLGIHLARLEGEVAFPMLLQRMHDIELSGEPPQWTDTLVIRGPKSLPVSYRS